MELVSFFFFHASRAKVVVRKTLWSSPVKFSAEDRSFFDKGVMVRIKAAAANLGHGS